MYDKLTITNFLQTFECACACDDRQCLQCAEFWNAYYAAMEAEHA